MISEQADEPSKNSSAPAALGETKIDFEASGVAVCYSRCWSCMFDYHHEEPTWHTWADADDVEVALANGQADPSTQRCGCWCARA